MVLPNSGGNIQMKKYTASIISIAAILNLLLSGQVTAANLIWDANGSTAGLSDGAGNWQSTTQWWDGASNVGWTDGSDAVFGNGGTAGAVTNTSPIVVNSLTFSNFSGTYTLGTLGQTMTLNNGITINSGAAGVTINSPILLGAAQTWSNGASGITMNFNDVANNGYMLTFDGSGNFWSSNPYGISGTGGLTKNGTGTYTTRGTHTYTGPTIINQGLFSGQQVGFVSSVGNCLGMSSPVASNLVLGSGATLQDSQGGSLNCDRLFTISGSTNGVSATIDAPNGTFNFTATGSIAYGGANQTRTLILSGTASTCAFAPAIGDNGTAPVSVTKTGSGTWQLNGTNSYTGSTTLSAGELIVNTSNNLGAATAILVFNGGTLQITNTTLTSLSALGHPIVCNPGMAISLDINNAANTFTVDQVISGSRVSIAKSGAGTLVLNQDNTYGGLTTISGGVLRYDDGATVPTTPLLNNGTLLINRTNTFTQGVNFHSIMGGTGSLTNIGSCVLVLNGINTCSGVTKASAGTITLSHALALMNSAIDTTGAGAITLSGVTTPTFGGLSGATGDLGTGGVLATGYSGVTALTLNPQTGITFTYGGVIGNGSGTMPLTMAGAGTQVLQGINTYSGATYLNAGTLELSGSGSILNSAVTLSGGGLKLSNTAAESGSGRIADGTGITANGGTITYNNTSGANTYAETIGPVTLSSGQLNIVEAVNQAGGGSQTLTLGGLNQSGQAAVTFSAATTGPQGSGGKNMIVVSGKGSTTGGQIIGPWATVGTAANAQTDYAVYNANYVTNANIAASVENTWSTAGNAYTVSSGATLTGNRTITALRATGAAQSLNLGGYTNFTYGVLNGGSGALTISNGVLTTQSGGGNLFLTAGSSDITIAANAAIRDNGGAVALVKSGSGTLMLFATNTFTGNVAINQGVIQAQGTTLGQGTNITFAGSSRLQTMHTMTYPSITFSQSVTVNSGAIAEFMIQNQFYSATIAGPVSGDGTIYARHNDSGFGILTLSNATNSFTGVLQLGDSTVGQSITLNSLADSTNRVRIFAGAAFTLGSGAASPLIFGSRQIELAGATGGSIINNNGTATNTITINTDLLVSAAGSKTLTLDGSHTGTNIFAGRIADGPGSVISLTKAGSGTWYLPGTNTYTGATTISAGTLEISGGGCLGAGGAYAGNIINSATFKCRSSATQTWSGVISGTQPFEQGGSGTLYLSGMNTFSGATTVTNGMLVGVVGGSCSNSSITVTNTPGITSALGVLVSDNTKQWTCPNLTFKANGTGAQLKFTFTVTPSTTLAPLNITNNLTFFNSVAPLVVVDSVYLSAKTYPLLVAGGTAPTSIVPELSIPGQAGKLGWTGNTLSLTIMAPGMVITIR